MTRADKEEMLDCIEEELLPLIETLSAPSHSARAFPEWEALMAAATELRETVKETRTD